MLDTFNGGYTKALLDVQHFFEMYSENLKFQKLYSEKGVTAIIKFLIENREELRETGMIENFVVHKDKKSIKFIKKK